MTAQIIDGKKISADIRLSLKEDVDKLRAEGVVPTLAVVLVGEDPASKVYVGQKEKGCAAVGIESQKYVLSAEATREELLGLVKKLNEDKAVHGILVQLPLPKHLDEVEVINAISPEKDVDGFHPISSGLLMTGQPALEPCTPKGVIKLIESTGVPISGKNAVVIGRSNIVGKPVALMLLSRNATVTITHSKTANLADVVRGADIVVAAIGKPNFVTADMIKEGAVIIDVGINRTEKGLVGDVDFASVSEKASWITPVPGGVGPMTISMLLSNTVQVARKLR